MRELKQLERKAHGTPSFPCVLYPVDRDYEDYRMPFHWHPVCEIVFVKVGTFDLSADDESMTLDAGDVAFLAGGVLHGGVPRGEGCVYDCILFDPGVLSYGAPVRPTRLDTVPTALPGAEYPEVAQAVAALSDALRRARMTGADRAAGTVPPTADALGALGALFSLFAVLEALPEPSEPKHPAPRQIGRLKNVIAYMEEHYAEKITLPDLAAVAGITPKYLCRAFLSLTGTTVVEYLNRYRVECASEMLRDKSRPISDVAVSAGFSDQSYFIRWFRRVKGTTPGAYRAATP